MTGSRLCWITEPLRQPCVRAHRVTRLTLMYDVPQIARLESPFFSRPLVNPAERPLRPDPCRSVAAAGIYGVLPAPRCVHSSLALIMLFLVAGDDDIPGCRTLPHGYSSRLSSPFVASRAVNFVASLRRSRNVLSATPRLRGSRVHVFGGQGL